MDGVEEAYRGDLKLVKKLITVDNVDKTDENQYTALMWAAFRDQTKVVSYLLELKANINAVNVYGRTAIMLAAQNDSLEAVRLLALHGADLSIKDRWNEKVTDFGHRQKVITLLYTARGPMLIGEFFHEYNSTFPTTVIELIRAYYVDSDSPLSDTSIADSAAAHIASSSSETDQRSEVSSQSSSLTTGGTS